MIFSKISIILVNSNYILNVGVKNNDRVLTITELISLHGKLVRQNSKGSKITFHNPDINHLNHEKHHSSVNK